MSETTTGNKKWYVIRAISGKEKKVKQYIESEIIRAGLSDYVSQVLIPMEKYYQIKDGKKISKERAHLPGYVLLEAELVGEIPHIIENTTGVIGFLGSKGEAPTPLRQSEVYRILGKVDELVDSEEVINIPTLNDRFNDAVKQGYLNKILDEVVIQSKVEFNYEDTDDDEE